MKKLIILICFLLLIITLAACAGIQAQTQEPTKQNDTEESSGDTKAPSDVTSPENKEVMEQTGYTAAVPSSYKTASDHPGTVTRLDYDSKDYVRDGAAIAKTAYVYTPYGYDENDEDTRYNIVYLMHGWGGHAGEYFEYSSIKNMFDHLIENGDIPPVIIVSTTFYNENSNTDFSGSIAEFRQFHRDFEENLMPTVEGRFHTYAKSASDEDLKASRDHRAFGGFSLGSVTTWLQFCYDTDYIRYFLPMSGSCWYYGTYGDFQIERNVDFIEQLVKDNDLDERGYFIYHAVGTQDAVKSQSIDMAEEMLERSDVFTPEHYVFHLKEGGYHDFNAVQEYLYNALPLFFRDSDKTLVVSDAAQTAVYTKDTGISDVQNDPAFGDYGRLLFPVNSGYMSGDTLESLRLTWYNNIDPDKTVEICNYMRDHAETGDTIFYDIYTEEEKKADSAKRDTGLFFFKGDPGRAIAFIFEHAEELEVDTSDYSLWGGSAGARMAAWLGSYGTESFGEDAYPRPAAVFVNYTGLSEVYGNEPPTYSAVGTNDGIASYRTMERRIHAIQANGTDAEIEVFHGLSHGFGLGTGTVAEGWIDRAVEFWERNMKNK